MNLFNFNNSAQSPQPAPVVEDISGDMAKLAMNYIEDGVIVINSAGVIQMVNPAAVTMTGYSQVSDLIGANYVTILRCENSDGNEISDAENPLFLAVQQNQNFATKNLVLITIQEERIPVAISVTPTDGPESNRIIVFRNIETELKEESEQTEFISTASHEMRTPVASIEGYLGLALNPATATIDDRARKYLEEAHSASQHLGNLFRDLLDVTKLDDHRAKVRAVPVDLTETTRQIANELQPEAAKKNLAYSFGQNSSMNDRLTLNQKIYASIDIDFLREILNNLIENAIKYTPSGGTLSVGVRGDGDRAVIFVQDSGIGISPEDLKHVFQKFYRADNSQTRTIGGTGLGLYIVKCRVEAMGGRCWAESTFGQGSTFYVELPRLSPSDFQREKQLLALRNAGPMGNAALQG
ncbi:MAG: ATP-binding protein [Candidatus Saccharibacteria bacterium]|nr:ATP-binding protein [Candidatus Saccharibacteria bacterium]